MTGSVIGHNDGGIVGRIKHCQICLCSYRHFCVAGRSSPPGETLFSEDSGKPLRPETTSSWTMIGLCTEKIKLGVLVGCIFRSRLVFDQSRLLLYPTTQVAIFCRSMIFTAVAELYIVTTKPPPHKSCGEDGMLQPAISNSTIEGAGRAAHAYEFSIYARLSFGKCPCSQSNPYL